MRITSVSIVRIAFMYDDKTFVRVLRTGKYRLGRLYRPSPRSLWILERVLNDMAADGKLRPVIDLTHRGVIDITYVRVEEV